MHDGILNHERHVAIAFIIWVDGIIMLQATFCGGLLQMRSAERGAGFPVAAIHVHIFARRMLQETSVDINHIAVGDAHLLGKLSKFLRNLPTVGLQNELQGRLQTF